MTNPVSVSIPGGRGARFSIGRDSELGQKADIVIRTTSGAELTGFSLEANPVLSPPKDTTSHPETRVAEIKGFYHYFSQGYKLSPDGKIISTADNGNTIVVGFDDNGPNDTSSERDYDFNDCIITINLT